MELIYFPVMGLGEPIRYILSYAGIEFQDTRLSITTWKLLKDETPFGTLPLLKFDDKTAHQSVAICRYLATLCKINGDNPDESLEIDSIVYTISDLRTQIALYNKEDNESSRKMELKKNLINETIPFYLQRLEAIIKKDGYLANKKLSWGDLFFVAIIDYCNGVMEENILKEYPNLTELKEKIVSIPSIKEWIKRRPLSNY